MGKREGGSAISGFTLAVVVFTLLVVLSGPLSIPAGADSITPGSNGRVVIMLDVTGSTSPQDLENEKAAVRNLLASFTTVTPRPSVALGTFYVFDANPTDGARIVAPLTQDYLTPGAGPLYTALEQVQSLQSQNPQTDLQQALNVARVHLLNTPNTANGPNFVIVITDGFTNRPGPASVSYDYCGACGCADSQLAAKTAREQLEAAPLFARVFAIHYVSSGTSADFCPAADGAAFLRDTVATYPSTTFFKEGTADLSGVFATIGYTVVCDDAISCTVDTQTVSNGQPVCVHSLLHPEDPAAAPGLACTVPNSFGPCVPGHYDNACECVSDVKPSAEICDLSDNDCNGQVDDNCSPRDCNGIPGGAGKADRCGICGGDGMSCLGCTKVDLSSTLQAIAASCASETAQVTSATRLLLKAKKDGATRRYVKKTLSAGKLQKARCDKARKEIKSSVQVCSNKTYCVQDDHSSTVKSLNSSLSTLKKLTLSTLKKIPAKKKSLAKQSASLKAKCNTTYQAGAAAASKLPRQTSTCK